MLQARNPGEAELVMVHNEHLAVSYTYPVKSRGPRWIARLLRTSVGNGLTVDKPLCQFGLPIGVKHVMRRSRNVGNITALTGGILATLAFFLFPYISLGIFGSYTAVQLAEGIFGSSAPVLWLELLVALAVMALAGLSWSGRSRLASLPIVLMGLSGVTLLIILGVYMAQTQQQSLLGSAAAFYATGFWLYVVGIAVVLAGGIIQLTG